MSEEFALFIDDSGSPKPNLKDSSPYFALGGILVKRKDEILIKNSIDNFKQRWNIPQDYPLHGNEIRSKKRGFAWLGKLDKIESEKFMNDLTQLIVQNPIIVHACVISRSGYCQRYSEKYGEKTWEMMKSAFSILVERCAKYTFENNGKMMIYYEKMGKKEDRLIENYFEELRQKGLPFDTNKSNKYFPLSVEELNTVLSGIEGKSKNRSELQIADLCLYPVVRSKDNPENKAFIALKENNLIIDQKLDIEQVSSMGLKYYCFD
jgi:Protein of unknown function (DUF3800)